MKLRTAKKIYKAIGTDREVCYSQKQIIAALDRMEQTRSSKRANALWNALMSDLGPSGRAEVLARTGAPHMALELLMNTPEQDWNKRTVGEVDKVLSKQELDNAGHRSRI